MSLTTNTTSSIAVNSHLFEGMILEDVIGTTANIETVSPREDIDQYIENEYRHTADKVGLSRKNTLMAASEVYGKQMHRIRGDGNCGTTAFATGLLYNILQNSNTNLISTTIKLMLAIPSPNELLSNDIAETMGLLAEFENNLTDDYLREALLANNSFMLAFSRVIRAIGHQGIKDLMKNEFGGGTAQDLEEYAEDIIPNQPGEEISMDGYNSLSQLFNVKTHVIDITGQIGTTNQISQYPETTNTVADIVIIHSINHFFTIVTDKQRQEAHGLLLTTTAKGSRTPLPAFTLQQRKVRPVQQNSCCTIATIAISVIGVIGLLFAKSYI